MKKNFLFSLIIALVTFSSCEWHEMDKEMPSGSQVELESKLIMKVGAYSSLTEAEIFIEKDVATAISISSKDVNNPLVSASWKINDVSVVLPEGSKGLNIVYTFKTEGSQTIEVVAIFQSQKTETRSFKVTSVMDLSNAGPIIVKAIKLSSSYDVWVGWNLKWTRGYPEPWAVRGDMTNWVNVPLPSDNRYNINSSGSPIKTTDVGSYVGAWFNIKDPGTYKIVLVYGGTNWVPMTGSPFVKVSEPAMVIFQLNSDGSIIAKGDGYTPPIGEQLPGTSGDYYFRFTEVADAQGKISLFFRLTEVWTNKSFCVRDSLGGYTETKFLSSVTDLPNWGVYKEDYSNVSGSVSNWRYGSDVNASINKYSTNMGKSVLYDDLFKSLRLQLLGFQATKRQE